MGISSVGRAPVLYAVGAGFESRIPDFRSDRTNNMGVWLSGKSGGLLTRVSAVPVFSELIARIVYSGHAGSNPAAPLTIGM